MRKSVQLIVSALFLCLLKLPQLESVPQLTVQTSVENSFSYADSICSPISYLDRSLLLFQAKFPEMIRRTLICEIRAFQINFQIKIRVFRIWRPRKYNNEMYNGLHYVLVDKEGNTIHAIIDESDYPYVLS
ncbi:hypothetical protein RchiOBHm_Chr5g0026781 [Rosa chinensis]|uniref:Replication protein A 70 kDa DNA-binding subunit B/D first OB fold domain-containing protein n=1 Tax=Rosa chinensis TaxID=74649 RepID=A0A2P6Q8Y6_ROSCH|nr:hypothetical protein RchiOBHm_Chr5g0026781 [Rosa chinensis]